MKPNNILDVSEICDETGKIRAEFPARDASGCVPDGVYVAVREDGLPLLEITYREGVVHGRYVDFWSNGQVASEGQFCEGQREGPWHFYEQDGTLMDIVHFKKGKESGANPGTETQEVS